MCLFLMARAGAAAPRATPRVGVGRPVSLSLRLRETNPSLDTPRVRRARLPALARAVPWDRVTMRTTVSGGATGEVRASEVVSATARIAAEVAAKHAADVDARARFPRETFVALKEAKLL